MKYYDSDVAKMKYDLDVEKYKNDYRKREWFWIFNVMFISLPRKCNYGTLTKIVFCWISFTLKYNYLIIIY